MHFIMYFCNSCTNCSFRFALLIVPSSYFRWKMVRFCSVFTLILIIIKVVSSIPIRNDSLTHRLIQNRARAGGDKIDMVLPDHLNGLKMERDGHINKEYHKEVFLGRQYDEFKDENDEDDKKAKLYNIFLTADTDENRLLDSNELTAWVLLKTQEHFREAADKNRKSFEEVDINEDGRATWNEFISFFLNKRDFDRYDVLERLNDGEKITVNEEDDIAIEDLRDKWLQAEPFSDNSLDESRFMDFQHPETSKGMLKNLVDEFMHDMDVDGSRTLSVQEYVAMSPEQNVDQVPDGDIWTIQRREDFRNVIDRDQNGLVDEKELDLYLDPLSESMAEQEAQQMLDFGDDNGDGYLQWDELFHNSEFFTGSKLFNYGRSVHEEF